MIWTSWNEAPVEGNSSTRHALLERKEPWRSDMARNMVRSILGLVLVAAATWLANYVTEQIFGPDESEIQA